jgi:hypothetical protein
MVPVLAAQWLLNAATAFPGGTSAAQESPTPAAEPGIADCIDLAPVWSAHPVGFCLLTGGKRQFAAFYDAERKLTVASRSLDSRSWTLTRLPRRTGWDSHNYVTMTADDDGFLHLAGDMHCAPLVYFRSARPFDATTFEPVHRMTGEREARVTYPRFLRGAAGELLFTYRDGSSGAGDQIFNVYDHAGKAWRRFVDQPLLAGMGEPGVNAYYEGPVRGPDGLFHMCWVWRDHGGCESNHDVCYARSRDLAHWERSDGVALNLPITPSTAEVVDPVPVKGGLINGNTKIGFDARRRVIIGYHKYDAAGNTQIYNARLEDGAWRIRQTSDWDFRWEFSGGGSIAFEVGLGPVSVEEDGSLSQDYSSRRRGGGTWKLDEATLKPVGILKRKRLYPASLGKAESAFPEMQVRWCSDSGAGGGSGRRFALRWEALGPNRDRPREAPWPEPSMLRLYEFSD